MAKLTMVNMDQLWPVALRPVLRQHQAIISTKVYQSSFVNLESALLPKMSRTCSCMVTFFNSMIARPFLGLRPASERRRYFVTTSLIGWARTWNRPWITKQDGRNSQTTFSEAVSLQKPDLCYWDLHQILPLKPFGINPLCFDDGLVLSGRPVIT